MIKHKHGNCPQCGGPLRAETLGWRCDNCRGFIDMIGGKFYAYEEKPFLPPMTNGDRIRAMSDEELADFFFESPKIEFTVCEYCEYFGGHISETPCKHDMGICFVPAKNEAFKKWLKQPAEEEE